MKLKPKKGKKISTDCIQYENHVTFCPGSIVNVMFLRTRSRSDRYRKERSSTLTCPFCGQARGGRWPLLSHEAWKLSKVGSLLSSGGMHRFPTKIRHSKGWIFYTEPSKNSVALSGTLKILVHHFVQHSVFAYWPLYRSRLCGTLTALTHVGSDQMLLTPSLWASYWLSPECWG